MLAVFRRPVLTRTLVTGVLAASVAGFPGAIGSPADAATPTAIHRVLPGTVLRPTAPVVVLPVTGYQLTGRFGDRSSLWASVHTGLDFAAPSGTPIRSIGAGVVTSTGFDGRYGNRTVVTLTDGTELWYCHQSVVDVHPGQRVRPGQRIGAIGSTGNVTGPHLHLEVRPGAGDPVDPYAWLVARALRP